MKIEVQSAVDFLTNLLSKRIVGADKVTLFNNKLEDALLTHYKDHWFPEKPNKGSGYRCIRIVNRKMDPLIARAGASIGLSEIDLLDALPTELTLWVDPEEVSYRIGEDGSIGVLFETSSQTSTQSSSDSDYSDSDSTGSLSSSPSPSQEYMMPYQQLVCGQTDYFATGPSNHYSQSHLPPLTHWEYLSTFVAS